MVFDSESLREEDCASAREAFDWVEADGTTWIDVRGLGDGTLVQEFGELLGLHPLAVSDVVNLGQRPKMELYDQVVFAVVRMVTTDEEGALQWEQVSLFVGPGYLITFQETHDDCLEPLRQRIRMGRPRIRRNGSDYLGVMVLDAIVDGYFPILERFGEQLERLEDQILEEGRRDALPDLYRTKRDLASFRRAAWPMREALAQTLRDEESPLGETALLYARDTLDHAMQVVEVSDSCRELVASLADVHLSMVGQRTNDVMKVLTVVSAVFIPLTFLAGLYGMNFDTASPWNLPELGWRFGYPVFLLVCSVIACLLLLLFRRLGWLAR